MFALLIEHRTEERFKGGGVYTSCADAVPGVFARLGGDFVVRAKFALAERGEYRDVHVVLYMEA